jgi:hypothetical protein
VFFGSFILCFSDYLITTYNDIISGVPFYLLSKWIYAQKYQRQFHRKQLVKDFLFVFDTKMGISQPND